jgi:hypothetical protein
VSRSTTSHVSGIVLRVPGAGPPERRPGPDGSAPVSGRHAALRPVRWQRRVLAALVAGALVAGGTLIAVRMWGPTAAACVPVQVVAAPEIAPLVDQVARRLDDGGCAFTIVPRSAAVEAEALALADGSHTGSSDTDGRDPPQVWLPESTAMLARARELGAAAVPASAPSVAASPVVMAVTDAAAAQLGPGRPTCDAVFRAAGVVVGAPDPTRDPVGLGALVEAQADLAPGPDGDAELAAFLRRLQGHLAAAGDDLSAHLPAPAITAFPATEQEVLRHNVTQPREALTAAYPDEAPTWMDYPFTVLGTAGAAQRDAATRLLAALRGPDGQAALGAGGFRTPDGRAVGDRTADGRTVRDLPAPTLLTDSAASDAVLQKWATVTRSGRVEVLIDVSGSMNALVPKLGRTRLSVALDAAARGLTLFEPTTSLGLWTFAARLDGDRDYRQVVPVTPIPQLLSGQAAQALRSIRAIPGGHTGLYDSVLGLYEQALQNWAPGRLNVVVVMTDGNNDDPTGISRAELLRRLRAESDPRRPVTVMGVAIGPDVDTTELDQIAQTTGGRSFVVADPGRIDAVFFTALGALAKV